MDRRCVVCEVAWCDGKNARYCSAACRQRAYRLRKAAGRSANTQRYVNSEISALVSHACDVSTCTVCVAEPREVAGQVRSPASEAAPASPSGTEVVAGSRRDIVLSDSGACSVADPLDTFVSIYDEQKALNTRLFRAVAELRSWQVEAAESLASSGESPAERPTSSADLVEFYRVVMRELDRCARRANRPGTIAGSTRVVYEVAKRFGVPVEQFPGPTRLPRAVRDGWPL